MSTSCIGTVLDAIQDGLSAVADLSEVKVFSCPVDENDGGKECIWFGDAEATEDDFSMAQDRNESWTVDGQCWAEVKPWEGDIESTGRAARDRVLEIFACIETYINDTYVSAYPLAAITQSTLKQGIIPDGRRCAIDFKLYVRNIKNP